MDYSMLDVQIGKKWLVLQTKPRHEYMVETNLLEQGFDIYLPRLTVRRKQCSKPKTVVEPLFPGYLFICVNIQRENIFPVTRTRGVKTFVRFGNHYPELPETLIHQLLKNEQNSFDSPEQEDFIQGDNVQIGDGSLSGLRGIYSLEKGKDRAYVLVEILGSTRTVCVEKDSLNLV